jgi:cyclopropane-fatty-acyl-phospholipid synthase
VTTPPNISESSGIGDQQQALKTSRTILSQLLPEKQRAFAVRLWNDEVLPAANGESPRFTLALNHPGALRRMFWPPGELTLAEAYLRGDFDIEGDLTAAMQLAETFETLPTSRWIRLGRLILTLPAGDPATVYLEGRQRAQLSGAKHSRQRDEVAVTYHYDTGNDFYRLFLGSWMTYSCAYFTDQNVDLDTAQAAKLELICRKLRLRQDERLLDIGCGWGGLVLYAAKFFGVQALGVTISKPQADYGNDWIRREGLSDLARIEVRDYRDLDHEGPFDKIVSVGMFEHVGRAKLPEYFQSAWRILRPSGLFLNHGIATHQMQPPSWLQRTFLQRGQFQQKYVFPDGELVPVSEALLIAEKTGFEVRDVESLREHYALTLRRLVANLENNREEAVRLKDERTYRTWRLFMSASVYGFERSTISVFQALLSKDDRGIAEVPLTREDIYVQEFPSAVTV